MPKSSLEELRGQISAGDYAIDSCELAADMLSKFALIRLVRPMLISEGEDAPPGGGGQGPQAPNRRRTRPASRPLRRAADAFRNDTPK